MKKVISILIACLSIFIINSCKEDKPTLPSLTTTTLTEISANSAKTGGNIISDGGAVIIATGVCWSTNAEPDITDKKTIDISDSSSFLSSITGLEGATSYFVRAYAINNAGIGYGNEISFTTLGDAPSATTKEATNYSMGGATLNGEVNANLLNTTVTFEYGTTTSYGNTVVAVQDPVTGDSTINVDAIVTGLTIGTTYHYRIMAVNDLGTIYGEDKMFIPGLEGLVAYYNFNDGIKDQSGNSLDGVAYGGTLNGDKTFSFDGNDDYIIVDNDTLLNPGQSITISLWFNPVEFYGVGNDAIVVKPYVSHTPPYYQYLIGISGSKGANTFGFSVNVNGEFKSIGTHSDYWTEGNWYHIVGMFDGQALKLYVNGTLEASLEAEGLMNTFKTDLLMGRHQVPGIYTPGIIDNIRIYNRALLEDEIMEIFNKESKE